jgi:LysM repeat protein
MTSRLRFLLSLALLGALIVVGPLVLVTVSTRRFGSAFPIEGWPGAGDLLADATSRTIADVVLRIVILGLWAGVALLALSVVAEVVFQVRHGMPSTPRRAWPVARLTRLIATGLVVVIPVQHHAPPLAAAATVHVVETPQPATPPTDTNAPPDHHIVTVAPGESVWAIAERFAGDRDVAHLADAIVARNMGRVMLDGARFTTPALVRPGWTLEVPIEVPIGTALAPAIAGTLHRVEAGDSYWAIAASELPDGSPREILALTESLIDHNAPRLGYTDPRMLHPGDLVAVPFQDTPPPTPDVPVSDVVAPDAVAPESVAPVPAVPVTAPSTTTSTTTGTTSTTVPPPTPEPVATATTDGRRTGGLAGAVLLGAGVIGLLVTLRRSRLRAATPSSRPPLPLAGDVATERLLRGLAAGESLARVDLAVRVATTSGWLLAAVAVDGVGTVTMWALEAPRPLPSPIRVEGDRAVIPCDVPTEAIAALLSSHGPVDVAPAPALVHLGSCIHGDLFVDLEAIGALSIDLPVERVAGVLRHLAATLAVPPFGATCLVRTVGLADPFLDERGVPRVPSVEAVIVEARRHGAALEGALGGRRPHHARAGGTVDAWEPFVVLSAVPVVDPPRVAGVAVVAPGMLTTNWSLREEGDEVVLHPLVVTVSPVELSVTDTTRVADLLAAEAEPLAAVGDEPIDVEPTADAPVDLSTPAVLVRTLGQVEVLDGDGRTVGFEKSKSLELVVWMAHHRRRSTRGAARTALWTVDVRDSTFANVVSDARRSLERAAGDDVAWIPRTLTDELTLHPEVRTDVEVIAERLERSRTMVSTDAIAELRAGLDLVAGMPFAGTGYTWNDAEGLTSAAIVTVTAAAAEMAEHCLDLGDVEGVFWATGQGLLVLPGHEELISLRMQAHAAEGDLAGVRAEWEAYERALAADPWSDGAVSPKLVRLRADLLSASLSA